MQPGIFTGSGKYLISDETVSFSFGKCKNSDKTVAGDGKKMYEGMLNSLATSKASIPNALVRKTAKWVSESNDSKTLRRDGRERETVRKIWIAGLVTSGRSSKLTGGRKMASMEVGRASTMALVVWEGGPLVVMMQVTWKLLCCETRRFANSTNGIKWLIPRLGSITM